jgi:biotin transport system substrate-specific component
MSQPTMVLARSRTETALYVVAFAAAAALASQVAVPIPGTPVPLALAPMAAVLAGLMLGPRAGAMSMALFVLAGAAGLPVFAPVGLPGIARLAGPTGGYLLAYPFAAALAGWVALRFPTVAGRIFAAAAGMVLIHIGGVAQLAILTGSVATAAQLGSAPFILADAVKSVAAGVIASSRARRA